MRFEVRLRIIGDEGETVRRRRSSPSRSIRPPRRSASRSARARRCWRHPARVVAAQAAASPSVAAARTVRRRCAAREALRDFRTLFGNVPLASPRLHRADVPARHTAGPNLQPADRAVHRAHRPRAALSREQVGLARGLRRDRRTAQGRAADRARPNRRPCAITCMVAARAEAELGDERPLHRRLPGGLAGAAAAGGRYRGRPRRRLRARLERPEEALRRRRRPVASERSPDRYLGLVQSYDAKPKRRLFDLLAARACRRTRRSPS